MVLFDIRRGNLQNTKRKLNSAYVWFTFISNRFIRGDRSVGCVLGTYTLEKEGWGGGSIALLVWGFLVRVPPYGYVQGGRTTAREAESQFYEFDPSTPAPKHLPILFRLCTNDRKFCDNTNVSSSSSI